MLRAVTFPLMVCLSGSDNKFSSYVEKPESDYIGQIWQKVGHGDLISRSHGRKCPDRITGEKLLSRRNPCLDYEFFNF